MPADDARLLRKLAHATEHAVAALEAAKQKQDLLAAAKSAADALENKSVPSSAGRVRGGIVVDVADPTAQVHSARADARHVKSNARQLTNDATAAASNVLAVVQAAAASDVIATLNRADQATTASAARAAVHTYWVKGSSEPTILATEMSKASGLRGLQPLELLNVFSAVDKTLTKPALVRALPLADPATVGRLFDIFAGDADGDGTDDIGYRTFVCAAAIMADAKPAAKLKLMFELCDEDSTGDLTRAELSETVWALLSAVSALSLNPRDAETTAKFRFQLADAVLAEADADNSGTITREEFVTWAASGSELAEFISQSLLMFLRPRSAGKS